MPWIAVLWIIVFLVRLLANEENTERLAGAGKTFVPNGKVIGHRGPDMRSFNGRAGRREWWATTIWCAIVGAVIGSVPMIGLLLAIPWTIGTLAVNARRLHDLTMSAWLQTIPMAIAAILLAGYGVGKFALGMEFDEMTTAIGAGAIALAYGAFYMFMGFAPGKLGPNAYGEAEAVARL